MKRYFTPCPGCSTPERERVEFRSKIEDDGIITCQYCGFQEKLIEIRKNIYKVVAIEQRE